MSPAVRPETEPVLLADLIHHLGLPDRSNLDITVTGVSLDSRAVLPGDLYAALPGHITHGASFAAVAVAAGAAAILTDAAGAAECEALGVPVLVVDRPRLVLGVVAAYVYGEPARGIQMLGVTGTNGKTTVAAMIESGLIAAGRTTGLIGTMGVHVGRTAYPGVRTTPEAPDLHGILSAMRQQGATSVVMEVSSIALEERRVDGVVYDIAAFTNLSQDHLDYHTTMESYFEAKAGLFTVERARFAVIGIDDKWGRTLRERCAIPAATWSLLDPRADWHAERAVDGLFVNGTGGERQPLRVPMPGAFNIANAVCAYAVLRRAGVSPDDAARGISEVRVPGRMQVVDVGTGVVGIVDYAHSPDAIERVLRSVREERNGRMIAVLGAGGDRDRGKRPLMGRAAAGLADVILITDDNPRSEDPATIRSAIREGALQVSPAERAEIHEVADRAAAIRAAVALAETGDAVLVLGKGHEQGQEAGGVIGDFDDATALRAALAERRTA